MRKTLLVALLFLAAALPLAAQSLTGTVSGSVKDESGGVLPGVNVTLAGKTGTRSSVTDAEGNFRFVGVDPGSYAVEAAMQGFRPKRRDDVVVTIGKVADVHFALGVGGKTESVEVVGEAPVVDVTSSSTDNSLSQDLLFNLPVRPTNAAVDLLNYLPGINDGSAYGGNSDYGNALLVDGVDTRDPESGSAWTFFNYNIVEEVQVGGLGASAEYGAYTGAVVNTLTKSGGNRFAGLFDAYWTKNSFSSDNVSSADVTANPSLKEPAVIEKRLDLTGQLSGPLIKDKLFFFVSAQRYEQKDNPSGPLALHKEVSPRFNTKLTWQASAKDNLSLNFQWDYYNQTGRTTLGALTTDAQTVNQDSPEAIWGLQWRHVFGSNTFAEVKYTGWWGYYYLDPSLHQPQHLDGTTGAYSGGANYFAYYDRDRNQANASISHFAEAFGKHDLKFGVEIERSTVRDRYGFNQGISYYDLTEAYPKGQYLAYTYAYDIEGKNQREALFAQDSWKASSRLTINAGVRVDFMRGKGTALANKTVYDNTTWAPRLGFAFDLTGDSKTVLKAHYGQYYDGMYFSQYSSALPGIADYVTYAYDPAGSLCGPAGNCFSESDRSPSPLYKVDPKMKHPRVDEWTVGFERALTQDVRFSATGIFRQDKNVQGSVRPDATWQLESLTTSTGSDASLSGIQVPAYTWTNRSASDQNILLTNPAGFQYLDPNGQVLGVAGAERKYKGLMFVLDKRFSNRWQGRISYVWSQTRGYLTNSGSNTYGADSLWETPTNILVNSYGKPLNDRPHELKLNATWQIPKIELAVTGYYRFLSGTTYAPYQRFSSKDINYPTSSGRQPFLEARGSLRLENENRLDLRLEKIFKIGGTDRVSVFADIQNVFNVGTVLARNGRFPTASVVSNGEDVSIDFNAPTTIVAPRNFILGARWSF